ncbi:MAG: nitroreductase family deazaflavin-dependent oxidoreductase [Acidimicrobiia bacterium]|nr:nitroreductase family deazaflavin-dependent oxidoreductase [Acidimicrobiia bacterium]
MGLLHELSCEIEPANRLQRLLQRLASTFPVARILSKILEPLDRALFRVTRGRMTVPGLLAGLPVIMVTTTGARSGKRRTAPLIGVPVGDGLAVIGSNFGLATTPGWVYNLEADPSGIVCYREKAVAVTARRADEREVEEVFRLAAAVYPGYAKYRARAGRRIIRVFVLESAI